MDTLLYILSKYSSVFGMVSIACATIIAVYINANNDKKAQIRNRQRRQASFASTIASELIDASHTLESLYLELEREKPRRQRVMGYLDFELIAYERLLDQIGDLGSSLSFNLMDVYGDIKKFKTSIHVLSFEEVLKERETLLEDIQAMMVKSISTSSAILFYSDYLNGPNFMNEVYEQRRLWLRRTLDDFCAYVAKIDEDVDFVSMEEVSDMPFLRRFKDKEDRERIRTLFSQFKQIAATVPNQKPWQAQLAYVALSISMRNTLTHFLQFEVSEYDHQTEQQYQRYLSA